MAYGTVAAVVAAVAAVASAGVTGYTAITNAQEAKGAALSAQLANMRAAENLHEKYLQQVEERKRLARLTEGTNIAQASKAGLQIGDNSAGWLIEDNKELVKKDLDVLYRNFASDWSNLMMGGQNQINAVNSYASSQTMAAYGAGLKGISSVAGSLKIGSSTTQPSTQINTPLMSATPTTYS